MQILVHQLLWVSSKVWIASVMLYTYHKIACTNKILQNFWLILVYEVYLKDIKTESLFKKLELKMNEILIFFSPQWTVFFFFS